MRFLVTGGAGYIGSHLVDSLISDGHHVCVIDNLSTGKKENLSQHDGSKSLKFYEDTVLNEDLLNEIVPETDGIYHLAASVGVKNIVENPLEGIIVNVEGSHKVIQCAARHKVKVLIASSSEVYGLSDKVPLKEEGLRLLGPTNVYRWSYAVSKALDEHLAYAYQKDEHLRFSIVRYFNSYGPRIDEKGYGSVIARFISLCLNDKPLTIFGEGNQTRSFTYVSDTVSGTRLAFEHPNSDGMVFNIGNQNEVTINDLATMVEGIIGVSNERVYKSFEEVFGSNFQETPRRQPDVSRSKSVLGFEASVTMKDGLVKTIDWAKHNYKSSLKFD